MDDESGASDDLLAGIEKFEPANPDREADVSMTDWLQKEAHHANIPVWLLADGAQKVAAYHTSEAGACKLRDAGLIISTHMKFAARAAGYPGVGKEIVKHLMALAVEHDTEYVTLDPFDVDTATIWEGYGFRDSLTRAQEDETHPCFRMARSVDDRL